MKTTYLSLAILCWFSIKPPPIDPIKLTIVNRSGMDVAVQLDGEYTKKFYYLRVAEGDQKQATEENFTVQRDNYTLQVEYLEMYDPVYGIKCSAVSSTDYRLMRSHHTLSVLPCDYVRPNYVAQNKGEDAVKKVGGTPEPKE